MNEEAGMLQDAQKELAARRAPNTAAVENSLRNADQPLTDEQCREQQLPPEAVGQTTRALFAKNGIDVDVLIADRKAVFSAQQALVGAIRVAAEHQVEGVVEVAGSLSHQSGMLFGVICERMGIVSLLPKSLMAKGVGAALRDIEQTLAEGVASDEAPEIIGDYQYPETINLADLQPDDGSESLTVMVGDDSLTDYPDSSNFAELAGGTQPTDPGPEIGDGLDFANETEHRLCDDSGCADQCEGCADLSC